MSANKLSAKHVLLTGLPGVGKTTLVRKLCEVFTEKNIPVVGFYTQEVRSENRSRIGFDVITLDGKSGRLARTVDAAKPGENSRHRVGNYLVFINEFESIVLPQLNKQEIGAILVLDEIGKMEMFSSTFIKSVTSLFTAPNIKILATIPVQRGKPLPLVEQLRNDSSNCIVTVTKENRNGLITDILSNLDIN